MSKLNILTKGFFKENPALILVLGCCPTLAVTTSVNNALGMGAATTFVLLMSNMIISALKNVIPDKVRIPLLYRYHRYFRKYDRLADPGLLACIVCKLGRVHSVDRCELYRSRSCRSFRKQKFRI